MKRTLVIIMLIGLLLTACSAASTPQVLVVQVTTSPWPTYTPYPPLVPFPTYTPYPTQTAYPTYTPWVVTVTSTSTPIFTETVTETPTETLIPTATISAIKSGRGSGFYLVNEEIASGIWRNDGRNSNQCYWEITNRTGDIISNFFGTGGGTMYVPASAFQVWLTEECGYWTYSDK